MGSKTLWAHRVPSFGTVKVFEHGDGRRSAALDGYYGTMDYLVWRALGGPAIREGGVKMFRVELEEVRSDD